MLQHVWERVSEARYLHSTLIATDDERIYEIGRSFGARVRMTRADHVSGTDRVAEAASTENADVVVNIQADEPLIDPEAIDAAVMPLAQDSGILMGTLKKRIEDPREITDPNVVKVVTDRAGDAIYFSRCPIPHGAPAHYKHIGLYVYQSEFLMAYPRLAVGPLERTERLEQLRALENGYRIRVAETDYESVAVDTAEDLERVRELFDKLGPREAEWRASNISS